MNAEEDHLDIDYNMQAFEQDKVFKAVAKVELPDSYSPKGFFEIRI